MHAVATGGRNSSGSSTQCLYYEVGGKHRWMGTLPAMPSVPGGVLWSDGLWQWALLDVCWWIPSPWQEGFSCTFKVSGVIWLCICSGCSPSCVVLLQGTHGESARRVPGSLFRVEADANMSSGGQQHPQRRHWFRRIRGTRVWAQLSCCWEVQYHSDYA